MPTAADPLRGASRLQQVSAYAPAQPGPPTDLRLDGNEGVAPPAELLAQLSDPELLRRYPKAAELEAILAARFGLGSEQALVTAGADDALDRICRALLEPGRGIVYCAPTFQMIPRYAQLAGGELRAVDWSGGPFPRQAFLDALDSSVAVVAVVSPNNPTGAVASAEDLRALAAAAPQALIVLDAAYGEFADDDPTAAALELPNAVVTRTLSKAWGLAGLRVGYALGSAEVLGWLRRVGQPYAVAGPSLALAAAWLERGEAQVTAAVAQIKDERARLSALLQELGAEVTPSQANFVLARFADAQTVAANLAGLGIAVRRWPTRAGLTDALRISCPGDAAAFARLEAALRAVLAPEALLFDMDGVLADVSGSYRKAIVATAASYGVELTEGDIAAAKAAGDANDDWQLTQRLLAARGVNAPLEEVTARFEALYQGVDGADLDLVGAGFTPAPGPGLWTTETLLAPRALFERLAQRYRLGIVTGRPRADALRFLESQGLSELFPVLVAREDAPALKPDPAPVRVALERLSASAAWMFGDTPDDLRAARAADVVPVGVLAPGEQSAGALAAAGAGIVLQQTDEITDLVRATGAGASPAPTNAVAPANAEATS